MLAAHVPARGAEHDVREVFAVEPGCTLRIDTYRGEIEVTESDEPTVVVAVHMEVGGETDAAAQRVLDGLQLQLEEVDNVVTVRARNPRETRARWVWREDEQVGLFYRITVPRACNVEVKNARGDVTIGRVEGRVAVEVKTGTVFLRGVNGDADADVGEGDLVISRCTGDVKARVGSGKIRTGLIGGAADLKAASGSVEVMAVRGGIRAQATAGDVTVTFPRDMRAGAALKSSGGDVFVRIDPAADCVVQATSKWGEVRCALPLAVAPNGRGKRKLHGTLNVGGPAIVLHADGGDVRIEPGETLLE